MALIRIMQQHIHLIVYVQKFVAVVIQNPGMYLSVGGAAYEGAPVLPRRDLAVLLRSHERAFAEE